MHVNTAFPTASYRPSQSAHRSPSMLTCAATADSSFNSDTQQHLQEPEGRKYGRRGDTPLNKHFRPTRRNVDGWQVSSNTSRHLRDHDDVTSTQPSTQNVPFRTPLDCAPYWFDNNNRSNLTQQAHLCQSVPSLTVIGGDTDAPSGHRLIKPRPRWHPAAANVSLTSSGSSVLTPHSDSSPDIDRQQPVTMRGNQQSYTSWHQQQLQYDSGAVNDRPTMTNDGSEWVHSSIDSDRQDHLAFTSDTANAIMRHATMRPQQHHYLDEHPSDIGGQPSQFASERRPHQVAHYAQGQGQGRSSGWRTNSGDTSWRQRQDDVIRDENSLSNYVTNARPRPTHDLRRNTIVEVPNCLFNRQTHFRQPQAPSIGATRQQHRLGDVVDHRIDFALQQQQQHQQISPVIFRHPKHSDNNPNHVKEGAEDINSHRRNVRRCSTLALSGDQRPQVQSNEFWAVDVAPTQAVLLRGHRSTAAIDTDRNSDRDRRWQTITYHRALQRYSTCIQPTMEDEQSQMCRKDSSNRRQSETRLNTQTATPQGLLDSRRASDLNKSMLPNDMMSIHPPSYESVLSRRQQQQQSGSSGSLSKPITSVNRRPSYIKAQTVTTSSDDVASSNNPSYCSGNSSTYTSTSSLKVEPVESTARRRSNEKARRLLGITDSTAPATAQNDAKQLPSFSKQVRSTSQMFKADECQVCDAPTADTPRTEWRDAIVQLHLHDKLLMVLFQSSQSSGRTRQQQQGQSKHFQVDTTQYSLQLISNQTSPPQGRGSKDASSGNIGGAGGGGVNKVTGSSAGAVGCGGASKDVPWPAVLLLTPEGDVSRPGAFFVRFDQAPRLYDWFQTLKPKTAAVSEPMTSQAIATAVSSASTGSGDDGIIGSTDGIFDASIAAKTRFKKLKTAFVSSSRVSQDDSSLAKSLHSGRRNLAKLKTKFSRSVKRLGSSNDGDRLKSSKDRTKDGDMASSSSGSAPSSDNDPTRLQSLVDAEPSTVSPFVPAVVELCTVIIETRGYNTVGLYRIPGNSAAVNALRVELEHGIENVDFDNPKWLDINVVSSLLKSFFRGLNEALIPPSLYPLFIAASRIKEHPKRMLTLKRLMHQLPDHNFETLRYLSLHLHSLSLNSAVNKMDAHNLAIVFGPTLIRPPPDNGAESMALQDVGEQTRIIHAIVANPAWFFSTWEVDNEIPEPLSSSPKQQQHQPQQPIQDQLTSDSPPKASDTTTDTGFGDSTPSEGAVLLAKAAPQPRTFLDRKATLVAGRPSRRQSDAGYRVQRAESCESVLALPSDFSLSSFTSATPQRPSGNNEERQQAVANACRNSASLLPPVGRVAVLQQQLERFRLDAIERR